MSSSDIAGDESSSSNPISPPIGDIPLRHRRYSPTFPWEMALFTLPRPRTPPVMGSTGRTAFRPYTSQSPQRPPPPPPPPPGPAHGASGSRTLGFGAFPIGGGGGGGGSVAVGGGIRIGGSPSGRKRAREGGVGAGGGDAQQHCSVCNKGFGSSKALFGHMRSHPDRGWKGVHPPPTFTAEEEFADIRAAAEEDDGVSYRVPDLNHPPPQD